jgi:hypothetical protein
VFVEDFTTKTFCDTVNTTAWWNSSAGQLELFTFLPSTVGAYDTPDNAQRVRVDGDHAFVADYTSGLLVIDISDPTAPTLVGSYDTPGNAKDVFVAGDHAYVADDTYGLQVIDISDPTTPALAGSYDTPGNAWGVFVEGDYAYVGDYTFGLQVIDISDPTTPTVAGIYNTPGRAMGVYIAGDHAFVADFTDGLQVLDISDPTTPTLAGSYDTSDYARRVYVSGDHAFVADSGGGLKVIDISDPNMPTLAGSYNTSGSGSDVFVSGDRAFIADGASGLKVIDISDPTAPVSALAIDTPGSALSVCVAGEHAFVSDGVSGLQVIKVRTVLKAPTIIGYDTTYDDVVGVYVSGDHAFVIDFYYGLVVINITDPTSPTVSGFYDPGTGVRNVHVQGDQAFLVANTGFYVIDISNPAAPALTGTYVTPGIPRDVCVAGDYAYVADGGSGLRVIDVSDPANPASAGSIPMSDAVGVCVAGDYAHVAVSTHHFYVVDISDPTAPAIAGYYDTGGITDDVRVSGNYVFMANRTSGLQIIDVSNPSAPTLAGSYDIPGGAWDVYISGDLAFVTDGDSKFHAIDVSDPSAPVSSGSCQIPDAASGVYVSGEIAYLAADDYGLQAVRVFFGEEDALNPFDNEGRSLAVDGSDNTIGAVRLTTTQTNNVVWYVSADGGSTFQYAVPNGNWVNLPVPGADLIWSAALTKVAGPDPTVSNLQLYWLTSEAAIEEIADVPNDQGGWIRVEFTRSYLDFASETAFPIEDYGVWRLVEDAGLVAAVGKLTPIPIKTGIPVIEYGDKKFVVSTPDPAAAAIFPPGTWEWVATIPAVQQDNYLAAVPTTADSSASGPNNTTFVLTAHTTTPSVWYISAPDSGHSVDNIPPSVPEGFAVAYNTGSGNHLTWNPCPDDDFQYFRVYRSNDPEFVPSAETLVHSTTVPDWNDPEYDGWNVHYKITALDDADNESDYTGAGTATAVTENAIPRTYTLYQNVPNPFNPTTVIRYDVPASGGNVTLRIYDVSGGLVRTLVDEVQTPGEKRVFWYGRNNRGNRVATGVYFYCMTAPGFEMTRKMILLQ